MKVKVISWPWLKVIYIWKLKQDFLRIHLAVSNQILYASFQVQGNKNLYDAGHMTKMVAMPIYVKIFSKIFFSRTTGPIFMKHGM